MEYPQDIREFRQEFATHDVCTEYLIRSKWLIGCVCLKYACESGFL
jgi:hypothetical protein